MPLSLFSLCAFVNVDVDARTYDWHFYPISHRINWDRHFFAFPFPKRVKMCATSYIVFIEHGFLQLYV